MAIKMIAISEHNFYEREVPLSEKSPSSAANKLRCAWVFGKKHSSNLRLEDAVVGIED